MRNAEFDRETVLRSAMTAFMRNGYSKTSMQDLTHATGLHPGSIYCAFTNKRGLMLAALEQYQRDRSVEFNAFFSQPATVLSNLKNYLNHIVKQCASCDASQACLLTKALNELAEQDDEIQTVICSNLTRWQQAITEIFTQAKAQREIVTSSSAVELTQYLVMGIYGLRTFAHTHPEAEVLQKLADKLYQDVCRNEG